MMENDGEGEMMEFVTSVDNYFISLFTKLSDWFMRLTGRTNFFLAKIMVCVMIASCMVSVINFWFPLLSFPTTILGMVFNGTISLTLLTLLTPCDEAEKNVFSHKRMLFFIHTPILRFVSLMFTFNVVPLLFFIVIVTSKGIIDNAINNAYMVSSTAFLYLTSIHPPTPGKSKIREWAESFAAGFKKLVPIKIQN